MANSLFALLNQNVDEQLKKMPKPKSATLKVTHTWLNVWQTWATERRLNPKLEDATGIIGPSYLAITENPKINVWNKKQRLSVNSIDNMAKRIIYNRSKETSQKKLQFLEMNYYYYYYYYNPSQAVLLVAVWSFRITTSAFKQLITSVRAFTREQLSQLLSHI